MEITLKINEKTKEAKALLNYLENLSFVKIENSKKRYNKQTEKAIEEVKKGKVEKISLTDLKTLLHK